MVITNHVSNYLEPIAGGGRLSQHGVSMDNDKGKGQCRVDGIRATWHIREEEETAASHAKPAQSKK
jgi:hypothetical protein